MSETPLRSARAVTCRGPRSLRNTTVLSATNAFNRLLHLIDKAVPKGRGVVLRTFPDFDDQCRSVGAALVAAGLPVTILADDLRPPDPSLEFPCSILPARGVRAAAAYCRAPVVVHSHGVYGNFPGSRRKQFLNVWHGMPVKRLPEASAVGLNQTDLTVATSGVHARNLASTWRLREDQVRVVGIPRNDVLLRTARDLDRLERSGLHGPLAVWLPTFRSHGGSGQVDGTDSGLATQFEGADLPTVNEIARRAGYHILVKPHPLAPRESNEDLDHVTVWTGEDLRSNGWTLYELLSQADLLITDVSSVWIDFLLLDRPIVFAMSDLDEYREDRGTYFDVADLVPGDLCSTLDQLTEALDTHGRGEDPWARRRRDALRLHHENIEPTAARAVAELAIELGANG